MVQFTEGSIARDKALHGFAVSVSLQDGETVESDFYRIKDALLRWERAQGRTAASILIEYRALGDTWQRIEDFWLAKIESDHLIRAAFANVGEVELCLLTPNGAKIRQVGFVC